MKAKKQADLNVGCIKREFDISCRRSCLGHLEKEVNKMDSQEENTRAKNSFRKHSLLRNLINLAQRKEKKVVFFADRYYFMGNMLRGEKSKESNQRRLWYIMVPPHPTLGARVMKPGTRLLGWLWRLSYWKFSEKKGDKLLPETVALYLMLLQCMSTALGNLHETPSVCISKKISSGFELLTVSEH